MVRLVQIVPGGARGASVLAPYPGGRRDIGAIGRSIYVTRMVAAARS